VVGLACCPSLLRMEGLWEAHVISDYKGRSRGRMEEPGNVVVVSRK
jgi:hypothetical protein